MAEFFTWTGLIEAGGPALIVLFLCSIISLTVIVERIIYFSGKMEGPREAVDALLQRLNKEARLDVAKDATLRSRPVGYVLAECLSTAPGSGAPPDGLFEEVKSRAIAEKAPEMERYLGVLATLGTVSPYIGLLGTVLGIIRAFMSLGAGGGAQGGAGMNQLNAGIAEALIATAAGLFVAIPATIAFNYFRKKVNGLVLEMEIAASRLKTSLSGFGS